MYDGEVIKKALDLVIDNGSGSEPEPRTRTPISVIAIGILNPDKTNHASGCLNTLECVLANHKK